jgi:hypothetical protein
METKTGQLQIRVSPAEKAALKRLAAEAGLSLSAFVLERALPSVHEGVSARIRDLKGGRDFRKALSDLVLYLNRLAVEEFETAVAGTHLEGLTDLQLNCAAAAIEQECWRRGVSAPAWTGALPALEQPYFAWGLRSLRPHLMRVTPAAFKRRNVYIPSRDDPRR